MRLGLHHHPYKIQVVQSINDYDFAVRQRFCETYLDMTEDKEAVVNMWMSDKAQFHQSGYVNKQN